MSAFSLFTSVVGGKADIKSMAADVRPWPITDISAATLSAFKTTGVTISHLANMAHHREEKWLE